MSVKDITTCTAPKDGTVFLQHTGVGAIDQTIKELEKPIAEINSAFGFAPEDIRSYHDSSDGDGCTDTVTAPPKIDASDVSLHLAALSDSLNGLSADLGNFSDEMWVADLQEQRYDLPETGVAQAISALTPITEAVEQVASTTNAASDAAFKALRTSITESRQAVVDGVNHAVEKDAVDVPGWLGGLPMGVGVGIANVIQIGNFFFNSEYSFPPEVTDRVREAVGRELAAAKGTFDDNDGAIATLKQLTEAYAVPTRDDSDGSSEGLDTAEPPAAAPLETAPPVDSNPLPASTPPADTGSAGDPLEDLFNEPDAELPPSIADAMPAGGMPSMGGGSPMDSGMGGMGSPLGGSGEDPFGSEPLADALEDTEEEPEEEPLDDLTDDEDEEGDDELFPDDDKDVDADVDTPEADTDKDDADTDKPEESPENGDVAPVAADPAAATPSDDTAARTVDVGGGRQVTFPSAAIADAVQRIVDSAANGGKSVYMALAEAGFDVPPIGQDIGELVPPTSLREGDIVKSGDIMGIFIGNGDVMMENGEVKALSDVAAEPGFGGLFRVEEPTPAADGLNGPAQPVGDGSAAPVASGEPVTSTPGAVTEQAGTPGVPTDTKADDLSSTDATAAGTGFGATDNGAAGLDPSAAFPS